MDGSYFVDNSDPLFAQAVGLLLEIPDGERDLVPVGICGFIELAHYELTDAGRYRTTLPRCDADIGLTPQTTGPQALHVLDECLTGLIEASTELAATLRYHRARSFLRLAIAELPRYKVHRVSMR